MIVTAKSFAYFTSTLADAIDILIWLYYYCLYSLHFNLYDCVETIQLVSWRECTPKQVVIDPTS